MEPCVHCADTGRLFILCELLASDEGVPVGGWVDTGVWERCDCSLGRAETAA